MKMTTRKLTKYTARGLKQTKCNQQAQNTKRNNKECRLK